MDCLTNSSWNSQIENVNGGFRKPFHKINGLQHHTRNKKRSIAWIISSTKKNLVNQNMYEYKLHMVPKYFERYQYYLKILWNLSKIVNRQYSKNPYFFKKQELG